MSSEFMPVKWRSVAFYYALAAAISWPFYWWRDIHPESWAAWDIPGFLKNATYMWGPGLAALATFALFRRTHPRTVTLLGTSAPRSLAFYFLPLLTLAAAYAPEIARGETAQLLLRLLVISLFLTLGEELGWRGFLQDAVRPLSPVKRYVLIGVLWELWHFTNRTHQGSAIAALIRVLFFIGILIVLSWIIGEATDRGRSLLVAVTLHAWFNILFSAAEFFGASPVRALVVFGLSIFFWTYLLRTWPRTRVLEIQLRHESRAPTGLTSG